MALNREIMNTRMLDRKTAEAVSFVVRNVVVVSEPFQGGEGKLY